MISTRLNLEICARFLIAVAVMLSMMAGLTLWNRIVIRQNRAGYISGNFIVSDAHFEHDADGTVDYWLEGTIESKRTYLQERFFPRFSNKNRPTSVADLLSRYPKGSKIEVIYNPQVSDLVQNNGEALRVIEAGPTFWQDESTRFWHSLLFTFAPLVLGVSFLLLTKGANNQGKSGKMGKR